MRWLWALYLLFAAAVLARLSLFTVDRTEYVYVTQYGRHVATYDGADEAQAGLHLKWPWPVQSVRRLDRRLQSFDLPGAELMTRDPQGKTIDKTITLDAYVVWRIADAESVDRFIRAVGTPEMAQSILAQRVGNDLGAAVGKMEVDDLISTERARVDVKRDWLHNRLLYGEARWWHRGGSGQSAETALPGSLYRTAKEQYGVEVVDVRLRRSNHPPKVRDTIFERISSEREKKAADYISEGEKKAADILSDSERRISEMKARAEAEAVAKRGQADARADRIRFEAQAQAPELYAFLKKLEAYRSILGDNKTTLLLSTSRELFGTLFDPPGPGRRPGPMRQADTMPKEGGM
jgi:membrane protease subunit HflC